MVKSIKLGTLWKNYLTQFKFYVTNFMNQMQKSHNGWKIYQFLTMKNLFEAKALFLLFSPCVTLCTANFANFDPDIIQLRVILQIFQSLLANYEVVIMCDCRHYMTGFRQNK